MDKLRVFWIDKMNNRQNVSQKKNLMHDRLRDYVQSLNNKGYIGNRCRASTSASN